MADRCDVRWADVEPPHDGALDLGPALAPDLVEIRVLPQVVDGARKARLARQQ
jgi:hypothetical protein